MIETKRLIVRDFRIEDLASFLDCLKSEVQSVELISDILKAPEAYIDEAVSDSKQFPRFRYSLAICLKGESSIIGFISIFKSTSESQSGRIRFFIDPKYRGSGIASEAADAVLSLGLCDLQLSVIYAECEPTNLAAISVLKNAGMKEVEMTSESLSPSFVWDDQTKERIRFERRGAQVTPVNQQSGSSAPGQCF